MKEWKEPQHLLSNDLAAWIRVFAKHIPNRSVRHWLYRKFLVSEMGGFVRIGMDVEVRFPGNLKIGDNVQINDDVLFMNHGMVSLGDGVLIGPNVKFLTVYHDYEVAFKKHHDNTPCWQKGEPQYLPIVVENDVWIGSNVVIMPGTHIHHHCVVAANSTVKGTIESYSLIGGNPAKLIRRIESD